MTASATSAGPLQRRILAALAGLEDGAIIRLAFFAMLIGTLSVLYVDYRELTAADITVFGAPGQPVLPAFDPDGPRLGPGPTVLADKATLEAPLAIVLRPGGVLELTGTIDIGAVDRFRAEVEARGEYVETVALNSPGGSVADALAIGALIRERGFATSVAAGALCASSCPLLLASGTERRATAQSAIGVHQIYALAERGGLPTGTRAAGQAMSDAQKTTATITRHLSTMGVDPALWLHALETPPDRLYYLSLEELKTYRLMNASTAEP